MDLASGVGLLSAAALLFVWAYAAHRRPVPARWTRLEFLSSGICIVITGLLPIGGGYLAVAVMHPLGTIRSLGVASLVLLIVLVAACWVSIPRLLKSVPSAASTPGSAPATFAEAAPDTRPATGSSRESSLEARGLRQGRDA